MKTFEQFIKEQNAECIQAMSEDYCLDMPIYSPREAIQLVEQWLKLQQADVSGSCPLLQAVMEEIVNTDADFFDGGDDEKQAKIERYRSAIQLISDLEAEGQ